MTEQIYILNRQDQNALGAVRCLPGLQAAFHGEEIWLRGISATAKPDLRLRQLPLTERYGLEEKKYLIPAGHATPIAELPELNWKPLPDFLPLQLPVSALPARPLETLPVRLIPSGNVTQGTALLTDLAIWKTYAETAPLVRLKQTSFAVSDADEVIVLGTPLVPVPGKQLWLQENILLPSGYDFDPPMLATLLARKLNPAAEDLLLFRVNGAWERIPKAAFIKTTRSAVRLTRESREQA